jgi:hypothetical protein
MYAGERHFRTAFVLCRRRAAALHRPALRPEHRAQSKVPSVFRHWLWCSCVWVRLQPVCLVAAWYGFAVAPRRTSSGHALHGCATGAIASCAPRPAGVRWGKLDLAWRFGGLAGRVGAVLRKQPTVPHSWRRREGGWGGQEGGGKG